MSKLHQSVLRSSLVPIVWAPLALNVSCGEEPTVRDRRTSSAAADALESGDVVTVNLSVDPGSYSLAAPVITGVLWKIACNEVPSTTFATSTFQLPSFATGCIASLVSFTANGLTYSEDPTRPFTTRAVGDTGTFVSGSATAELKVVSQLTSPLTAAPTVTYTFNSVVNGGTIVSATATVNAALSIGGNSAPALSIRTATSTAATTVALNIECASMISGTALSSATCSGDSLAAIKVISDPYPTTAITGASLTTAFAAAKTLVAAGAVLVTPGTGGSTNGGFSLSVTVATGNNLVAFSSPTAPAYTYANVLVTPASGGVAYKYTSSATAANNVKPILGTYCAPCHTTAGTDASVFAWDVYTNAPSPATGAFDKASRIQTRALILGTMPPAGSPMPTQTEKNALALWIAAGAPQ